MKKVKYVGSLNADLTTLGVVVQPGDVIDVPDDFNNANFEDYVAPSKATSSTTSTSPEVSPTPSTPSTLSKETDK